MKSILIALLCAFVLLGCESGKDGESGGLGAFNEGNATGKVLGNDFSFKAGRTRPYPGDENKWFIELYKDNLPDPCLDSAFISYHIDFSLTKMVDTYDVTPANSVSFAHSINNGVDVKVATTGVIEVSNIANGYVTGRILTRFDDSNRINGEFWAKICD